MRRYERGVQQQNWWRSQRRLHQMGFVLLAVLCMSGCAARSVQDRQDHAQAIAQSGGLKGFAVQGGTFRLAGFYRTTAGQMSEPVIYIEGDGFAWIDRTTLSRNPTPRMPTALELAAVDASPTVVYLARPCQYIPLAQQPACNDTLWSSHRFSPAVIAAYQEAISKMVNTFGARGVHLVGFSGGGAIAAILAAQRSDVLSLRTVAGNLDHAALNRQRKATPLSGSLNAMDFAGKTASVPQIHYTGSADRVIPDWVANSYLTQVRQSATQGPDAACLRVKSAPGVSHTKGWASYWQREYTTFHQQCLK